MHFYFTLFVKLPFLRSQLEIQSIVGQVIFQLTIIAQLHQEAPHEVGAGIDIISQFGPPKCRVPFSALQRYTFPWFAQARCGNLHFVHT